VISSKVLLEWPGSPGRRRIAHGPASWPAALRSCTSTCTGSLSVCTDPSPIEHQVSARHRSHPSNRAACVREGRATESPRFASPHVIVPPVNGGIPRSPRPPAAVLQAARSGSPRRAPRELRKSHAAWVMGHERGGETVSVVVPRLFSRKGAEQGSVVRVHGLGYSLQAIGFSCQGTGFRFEAVGLGCGSAFWISPHRAQRRGFRLRVTGYRFRSGLRVRV
jgi:hypothetical protein